MGKSRKKAIVKDVGHMKDIYWQIHFVGSKETTSPFRQGEELPHIPFLVNN